jgi:transposase
MLAMAEIKYIKHLREKKGESIQAISDTLGIDWRTAKKYADCDDFNLVVPQKRKRSRPVMGPYETIVDAWLLADRKLPRKQRHTAKRIYDRLIQEYDFKGGERTVREYVALRKQQLGQEGEIFAQLSHPVCHSQADFGQFHAFSDGCLTAFQYLVLSFPYSNAGFAQVLPGENSECLQEGLKWIFEHIGGVPHKIRFDNLSAAVNLRKGDRKTTESFDRFCLHYSFEPEFCNVARGNEKGNVENKVGYSRRNWFVPIPSIDDIPTFNQQLLQKAESDMKRSHYTKGTSIKELFSQDQAQLLILPRVPYEAIRWDSATVDRYGRIKFDEHYYHGVSAGAGNSVIVKASWDTVEILNHDYESIVQYPRTYHQKTEAINWQAQFQLFSRKPRAAQHSVHFELLPTPIQDYLSSSFSDTRELKRRLRFLSQLAGDHELDTLALAITQAMQNGQTDPGAIRHEVYRLTNPERTLPLLEEYTPACLHGYSPDLSQYDRLTAMGGVTAASGGGS